MSWLPDTSQGRMVGDPLSSFVLERWERPSGVSSWPAQPTSGVFNQQLFSQPLSPRAAAPSGREQLVVFSGSAVHGSAPFRRR